MEDFDEEDRPEELQLMMCEEAFLPQIDYIQQVADSDIVWEGWDGSLPKIIEEKLKELNEVIKAQKSFSWTEGKYRTTYISKNEKE